MAWRVEVMASFDAVQLFHGSQVVGDPAFGGGIPGPSGGGVQQFRRQAPQCERTVLDSQRTALWQPFHLLVDDPQHRGAQ